MATPNAARLLSPEEIAVRAGQQTAYLRLPDRTRVYAERELRLRQLAAGHPMREYLLFAAELVRGQHALLQDATAVPLPDAAHTAAAARAGLPPVAATGWPRSPVWRDGLRRLLDDVTPRLGGGAAAAVAQALRGAEDAAIEQQADRLLAGVMLGLDLASAPFIAAALQAYWTHLVVATAEARGGDRVAPFGRTDDATVCPCCGSLPTASVTRIGAEESGYRYLHCSLCSAQWHMVRIKCAHCQGTQGIAYQSLQPLPSHALPAGAAAPGAVQAETCDACNHYLKVVHMEKDRQVEPVADDLATLTLDLLVSQAGRLRHGVNLLLLFGDPEPAPDPDLG